MYDFPRGPSVDDNLLMRIRPVIFKVVWTTHYDVVIVYRDVYQWAFGEFAQIMYGYCRTSLLYRHGMSVILFQRQDVKIHLNVIAVWF